MERDLSLMRRLELNMVAIAVAKARPPAKNRLALRRNDGQQTTRRIARSTMAGLL
jgi:hypothetical protein